jgi:hypothetical protein
MGYKLSLLREFKNREDTGGREREKERQRERERAKAKIPLPILQSVP